MMESNMQVAPSPFHLATYCGCFNALTGMALVPLIGLVQTSGGQAEMILERFWGEISGQFLATTMLMLGIIRARSADLALMMLLTGVRLALSGVMLPMMRRGDMGRWYMFSFRAMDTFVFSSTMVMASMAAHEVDRRVVSRTDLLYRNAGGFAGLIACAILLATAP
jgi:hypothetical protein